MKHTSIQPLLWLLLLLQPMSSCRSSKTAVKTQTTQTETSAQVTDAISSTRHSKTRTTTSVTVLPTTQDLPLPEDLQCLPFPQVGTVIITQETETVEDTSSESSHQEQADTLTSDRTQNHEKPEPRSRASPILNRLIALAITLCVLLLIWRTRRLQ